MASLADSIELYIKHLIDEARRDVVEISRVEIANKFNCVPSQINYVLQTRFSPRHGYLIESRRGGGGYIRIVKVSTIPSGRQLINWIHQQIGEKIGERASQRLLMELEKEGFLSTRQAAALKALLKREANRFEKPVEDYVRASLLRTSLLLVLSGFCDESGFQEV